MGVASFFLFTTPVFRTPFQTYYCAFFWHIFESKIFQRCTSVHQNRFNQFSGAGLHLVCKGLHLLKYLLINPDLVGFKFLLFWFVASGSLWFLCVHCCTSNLLILDLSISLSIYKFINAFSSSSLLMFSYRLFM